MINCHICFCSYFALAKYKLRNEICQGVKGDFPFRTINPYEVYGLMAKCALRDSLSIIYHLEQQFKRDYDREEFLILEKSMTDEKEPKPKLTLEQKIEQQEQKLKQLKAQKQAAESREKKKLNEQKRKDDTRRKILLGSMMLKKFEDEIEKQKILAELNEYLIEDRDRQLFDLHVVDR